MLCCELILCLTLLASAAYGQEPPDAYTHPRLGADSRIYNGREYIRNGTPAKGFANFEWDTLHPGSLEYDGIAWPDIRLEYDLAQDQLVIRDYSSSLLISLVPEKIRIFSIGPYHFRYMAPGASQLPEPGFYQELFASDILSLLARRHKTLIPPTSADETARYLQVNTYFIVLNGVATEFSNSKELLQVLLDKRAELKRFIQKNHLSFHRDFEGSLLQTVTYYRQIKF